MENSEVLEYNYKTIIAEGVDGTGKSTLVKNLKEKYNITVKDRNFISDIVYRLYDGGTPWQNVNISQMAKVLNNCIIIYCTNDYCYERSMKRGETNVVTKRASEKIQTIYNYVIRFIELYTKAKIIKYDWEKCSEDELVKMLKEVW